MSKRFKLACVAVLVTGSVALVSAPKPAFNKHQKAFYADPGLVAFVRPGLAIKIESANVASDGTITAKFKLTDPLGVGPRSRRCRHPRPRQQ